MPRKTFVGGEILLASELNGFLMDQSVMVFDNAGARATAIPIPVEGMVTYLKDSDAVETFSGSAFVPAANSASIRNGAVTPEKLTSGAVVQVVHGTLTSAFATASAGLQPTGLSANITPTSASSKILAICNFTAGTALFGGSRPGHARIFRNSNPAFASPIGDADGSRTRTSAPALRDNGSGERVIAFLDTPATTTSTNYQLFAGMVATNGALFINQIFQDSNNIDSFRWVSTITLMEVLG